MVADHGTVGLFFGRYAEFTRGGEDNPVIPVDPNNPDPGDNPVNPVNPDNPGTGGDDPVSPVDPNNPDPGDNPVNPVNPDNPGTGGDDPVSPVNPDPGDNPVTPTVPNDIALLIEKEDGYRYSNYYIAPDGSRVDLEGTDELQDYVFSGGHFYAAGSAEDYYYKDGTQIRLQANLPNVKKIEIKKLLVARGKVHIAGDVTYSRDGVEYDLRAAWWEDGVFKGLPDNTADNKSMIRSQAVDMAVSPEGSIYITGACIEENGKLLACFWKDGVLKGLSAEGYKNSTLDTGVDILFHGGKAYFAGYVHKADDNIYDGALAVWDEDGKVSLIRPSRSGTVQNSSSRLFAGSRGIYALYQFNYEDDTDEIALTLNGEKVENAFRVPAGAKLENIYELALTERGEPVAAGRYTLSTGESYEAFWRDGGEPTVILESTVENSLDTVAIEGGDVYSLFSHVTGEAGGCNSHFYYKNGLDRVDVGSPADCTENVFMEIIGGDVYTAGMSRRSDQAQWEARGRLLKNGKEEVWSFSLPERYEASSLLLDIALSADGSLYVAGRAEYSDGEELKALLWKDGEFRELHEPAGTGGSSKVYLIRSSNGG